ncbi:zinc alcohol dehydrogenase [Microdochium trichocladiopsis]|uniref:Zinc alcohol dehydrogenase n=1 Tax=Microdochium trichocladiopsis TaxID=1682393 RepID=A0A9P8XSC7_9PEZI|nr:zinc alcohol dehydrogenase [Microdochium trichocladiopsis]KAH7014366.1 zinc alcohol dehydrogenase [Microdochium trichocladiopsis]
MASATTAKAWRFTSTGQPSEILRLEEVPMPTLPPPPALLFSKKRNNKASSADREQEEWLIVRVAYTALNPGSQFHFNVIPAFARARTCTPELDFSGTVVDVWRPDQHDSASRGDQGPSRGFSKGDEVIGFMPITYTYPTGDGALTNYIRVPARYVIRKPESVTLKEGAGLMCASCSAVMLTDEAHVKRGDRVLIVGASGGIGTSAVQLAKSLVAESGGEGLVVAVCSGRNQELVLGLGADEVIDYTKHEDLAAELTRRFADKPFDAILDVHGNQAVYVQCANYLKAGADYVACSAQLESWTLGHFLRTFWLIQCNTYWPLSCWLGGTGRKFKLIAMMDPGRALMEKTASLAEAGTLKVCVDSVWEYENALQAYEILISGRARGKVLVKW